MKRLRGIAWFVLGSLLFGGAAEAQRLSRPAAVAVVGGDVSGTVMTVTGANTSRRLANRFVPTTLDYATPTGTGADASGAIQNLEEYFRSTAAGRGSVWFDPGSYTLAGTVFNPSGSMFIIPPGADVTGGAIVGITDASVVLPGHGGYVIGQHDQTHGGFDLSLQRDNEDDSIAPAYEQGTLYLRARNYSESASGVTHDMVNLEAQCEIASGNMSGRCWGADALVTANPGSDGYLVGYEVGMQNNSGKAAGAYGTITAKLGLHIVASGNAASTAGVIVASAGSTFADGIAAVSSALGTNFLDLIGGGFVVDKAGNINATAYTFSNSPGGASSISGTLTTQNLNVYGGEAHYANGAYADPQGGVARSVKISGSGLAVSGGEFVSGGIAADSIVSNAFQLPSYTPPTSSQGCNTGYVSWDASYLYVCVAANTWRRTALATW